jgi:hypothetical protein
MLMGCVVPARPPAVLSKEEVEAEKDTMRAIDARPIKKVAEAKQRKRKRLQVRACTFLLYHSVSSKRQEESPPASLWTHGYKKITRELSVFLSCCCASVPEKHPWYLAEQ